MIELKILNNIDPLKRRVEKQDDDIEYSPMDPPDAFAPPNMEEISPDMMHAFLQKLIEEHKSAIKEINTFEEVLIDIQQQGINKGVDKKLAAFFFFFDNSIIAHNKKEEDSFFPLLNKRLIEKGEHSTGQDIVTAIDMMEDDHIKALQLSAVVFNLFGLAMRLPDENSRLIVLDTAIEQGKALVELLKLHIFREDNIVFPLAHKYLTSEEFDVFLNYL